MQAYFGWAKVCSCSYCYDVATIFDFMTDWGRLGRVEIVTLRVGARAKKKESEEGERRKTYSLSPPPPRSLWLAPLPSLFGSFNMALYRAKTFARLMKTPAVAANKTPKVVPLGCIGLWKHNSALSEFGKIRKIGKMCHVMSIDEKVRSV